MGVQPFHPIFGKPTCWHYAVNVRMERQVLAPAVQQSNTACFSAKPLGAGAKMIYGFPYILKQKAITKLFVGNKNRVKLMWNSKNKVKIAYRHKFHFAFPYPLLFLGVLAIGAMAVAARIVCKINTPAASARGSVHTAFFGLATLDIIDCFPLLRR